MFLLYIQQGRVFFFFLPLNHQRKSWSSIWLGRSWRNLHSSLETGVQLPAPIWMEIDSPPSPSLWRTKSVLFIQWIILFQLVLVAPTLTSLLLLWNIWKSILRFLVFVVLHMNISCRVPLCLYGHGFLYLY